MLSISVDLFPCKKKIQSWVDLEEKVHFLFNSILILKQTRDLLSKPKSKQMSYRRCLSKDEVGDSMAPHVGK